MSFDPRKWLADYEQAGGGYALTPGGALVFLTNAIDRLSLTMAFRQIVNRPAHLAAIKDTIAAKEMR